MKQEDKEKRRLGRAATRLRRLSQKIQIFEVKVGESHLSKKKEEAKWFYNAIIASGDISKFTSA